MFFKLKITSKNTGFLQSYDPFYINQLLKLNGTLDQIKEKLWKKRKVKKNAKTNDY